MNKERLYGIFLICISAASFGAMPIFAKLAYQSGTNPVSILFLRFGIAALIMHIYIGLSRMSYPRGASLFYLFLMGAVGYMGQSFCYFTALTKIPAGLVAILLYLYPALVTIWCMLFLKETITKLKVIALVLALTGTSLVIEIQFSTNIMGILLGLGSALIYSVYIVAGSKVMRNIEAFPASAVIITSAGLVYAGLVSFQGLHLPRTSFGWVMTLAIAVISTLVAIVTFFAGLKRIGAVNASMISTLEPPVTVALAIFFLDERLTLIKLLGGLLIIGAAVLLAKNEKAPA
ncbi:MAG: DMT family transporter [Desulfobacteraceae bacterium]|nr:MAG: DMT family transporter [Desulfobacteraceae bacterium]